MTTVAYFIEAETDDDSSIHLADTHHAVPPNIGETVYFEDQSRLPGSGLMRFVVVRRTFSVKIYVDAPRRGSKHDADDRAEVSLRPDNDVAFEYRKQRF